MMHATDVSTLQVVGGWLLFTDMIFAAVLFGFWERAGRVRLRVRKR